MIPYDQCVLYTLSSWEAQIGIPSVSKRRLEELTLMFCWSIMSVSCLCFRCETDLYTISGSCWSDSPACMSAGGNWSGYEVYNYVHAKHQARKLWRGWAHCGMSGRDCGYLRACYDCQSVGSPCRGGRWPPTREHCVIVVNGNCEPCFTQPTCAWIKLYGPISTGFYSILSIIGVRLCGNCMYRS